MSSLSRAALPDMDRPRLPALTGLRFVAAAAVVLYHTARPLADAPWWLHSIIAHGNTGVTLFFVLSGFILAYTYLPGDPRRPRPLDARTFWAARLARIYPVYVGALFLALPRFVTSFPESPWLLAPLALLYLLLGQAWVPRVALLPWNSPTWSLSAEAFFYYTFPRVAPRLARCATRTLLALTAGCAVTLAALPVGYLLLTPEGQATGASAGAPGVPMGPWLLALTYLPLARWPEFLLGVLLGLLFVRDRQPARRAWLAPLTGAGALVLLAAGDRLPGILLLSGLPALIYGPLLYGLAGGGRPAALLGRRPLVVLGEASYALYLVHIPIWQLALTWGGPSFGTGWASYLLYLAGTLVSALTLYYAVERPCRPLLRRWLTPSPPRPALVPQPA